MESKKRLRSANFITAEVQLLACLVDNYKQIIENKKTDAVTNKAKESAWRKIQSSFNSCGLTTSVRSWKTLKLKYEGIKKNTKRKSSLQRQEMSSTRGGPSNAPEFEEKMLSICSHIKGLEASQDSDTTANLDESLILVNIKDEEEDKECQKEDKQDRWQPNTLTAPVSKESKSDTALLELQIETARKEQQFMEEKHKLQMLHLANDEKRKQEIHELLVQRICHGLDVDVCMM